MAQLLKYTEWQGANGNWYCNDVSDLSSVRSLWWTPARMLNLSSADYVKWLVENFHPDQVLYNQERDVLIYSWKKIADMRVFKNKINALARQHKFII